MAKTTTYDVVPTGSTWEIYQDGRFRHGQNDRNAVMRQAVTWARMLRPAVVRLKSLMGRVEEERTFGADYRDGHTKFPPPPKPLPRPTGKHDWRTIRVGQKPQRLDKPHTGTRQCIKCNLIEDFDVSTGETIPGSFDIRPSPLGGHPEWCVI